MEATTPQAEDELLALLMPCVGILASSSTLPRRPCKQRSRAMDPDNVFWLRHLHSSSLDEGLKQMEALELLGLLARVDWQLWTQVVNTVWPIAACEWEDGFECGPVEVGVEWIWSSPVAYETSMSTLWAAYKLSSRSSSYQAAKAAMAERWDAVGRLPAHVAVRIVLQHSNHGTRVLRHLIEIIQSRAAPQAGEGSPCDVEGFRVLELEFDDVTARADVLIFRCLRTIAASDVHLLSLPQIQPSVFVDAPELLVQSLWQFYGISTVDGVAGARASLGVTLDSGEQHDRLSASLLALRRSPSVRNVTITAMERSIQCVNWQWIAYALFSREAGELQRLQEVRLHVRTLRPHLVAAVKQILEMVDPLMQLVGGSGPIRTIETITASQFQLRSPPTNETVFVSDNPLSDLRVVSRSGEWMCVILPGWGQAWVHRDNIIASECRHRGPSRVQSVPSMRLTGTTPTSSQAVLDLLELVGRDTKVLCVDKWESGRPEASDAWCHSLFLACPALEDLELGVCPLNTLRVVVDGYASGVCRLQRLVVWCYRDTNVLEMFEALSDRDHAASRCLREFECHLHNEQSTMIHAVLDAALEALQRNQRLVYVGLNIVGVRGQYDLPELQAKITLLQNMGRTQVLGFTSEADNTRMRALLSAVAAHRSDAVGKLDAAVLTLIFELFVSKRTKCVRVAFRPSSLMREEPWAFAEGSTWN